MSGVVHDENVEAIRGNGSPGMLESVSSMAECLRAQAAGESQSSVAFLFGVNPLTARASVFYSSAQSELATAVALAALGSQWIVARSTPSNNDATDVDHVVLGPTGAFFIASRQHPHAKIVTAGRMILVNGRRAPYVRDALEGSERVTAALRQRGAEESTVRPLVTVGGASSVVYGRLRAPVPVIQLGELVRWLLRQPTVYSAAEVKSLAAAADGLESWEVRAAADSASVRLTARFERLRTEVDAARKRYRLWIVTGSAVALAVTAAMAVVAVPAIVELFPS